ncbi:uncharacterized protein LOC129316509 [Prosopis cineraria]|uniref:uncharacterized protein LOC129316509 n=1 Tax=Prosopis cineraria TaxID=364024 RepID=UPI00240F116B|nr:uncharacterized protein LOC129316509 [Prosopis cineraria]
MLILETHIVGFRGAGVVAKVFREPLDPVTSIITHDSAIGCSSIRTDNSINIKTDPTCVWRSPTCFKSFPLTGKKLQIHLIFGSRNGEVSLYLASSETLAIAITTLSAASALWSPLLSSPLHPPWLYFCLLSLSFTVFLLSLAAILALFQHGLYFAFLSSPFLPYGMGNDSLILCLQCWRMQLMEQSFFKAETTIITSSLKLDAALTLTHVVFSVTINLGGVKMLAWFVLVFYCCLVFLWCNSF